MNRTLSIVLTKEQMITCIKETPEFLMRVQNKEYTLIKNPKDINELMIELLWQVTKQYVLASRDVAKHMDVLYKTSRQSSKSELLYHLADLDRSIIYLSMAINENEPILKVLSTQEYLYPYSDSLHDVLVESHQAD